MPKTILKNESTGFRFQYIDALRGWAILLVIFGHCSVYSGLTQPARTLADHGMMGVHLFFIISAFTIFYMYDKHRLTEKHPGRNFFIRRIFRIAPLYWFAIVYHNLIWGALPESQNWHYALNFLFLNSLHPDCQTSVVPGGWSISIEMLFYCAVPLLFAWVRDLRRAMVFMLVCVLVLPLITYLIYRLINPAFTGLYPLMVLMFWERFPLVSIGSFSFGIWLFYFLKEQKDLSFLRRRAVNAAGLLWAGIMLAALAFLKVIYPPKAHFYSFAFMVAALMLGVYPWKFFVNRVTVFIGRISYSIYIFHVSVATWLSLWFPEHLAFLCVQKDLYYLVMVLSTFVLTVPLAWLGYHIIEQPFIRLSHFWVGYLEGDRRLANP